MVADDSLEPQVKAKLDDSELSDDLPKALQKVDLDLDDAPFLEDEEEEAPPEQASSEPFPEEAASEETKPSRKKLFMLLGAGLALLLIGAAVAFFLLRKPAAPKPEPVAPPVAPAPEPMPPPAPAPLPEPPPPPKQEIVMTMAPFLVEMHDTSGRSRFLTIRFTVVTTEKTVELEFKRNIIAVRDAVYYYLKNKSMAFLTNKDNAETLKKDVLSVINQFIGAEPLDNLLIEEFLVK